MEIFDVFCMKLENVILKVSQTHFPKGFYPKEPRGGHKFFKAGNAPLGGGGAVKYPVIRAPWH